MLANRSQSRLDFDAAVNRNAIKLEPSTVIAKPFADDAERVSLSLKRYQELKS